MRNIPNSNRRPALVSELASLLLIGLLAATSLGQQPQQDPDVWIDMAPTGALAEFQMPAKPRYVERKFTPIRGRDPITVKLHIAASEDGKTSYIFSYFDLAEQPRGQGDIKNILDGAVRGSLATVMGSLQEVDEEKQGRYPGRLFTYTFRQVDREDREHDFVVISRILLIRRRQYQLSGIAELSAREIVDDKITLAPGRQETISKFLNSFNPVKPKPDLPPEPRPGRADK